MGMDTIATSTLGFAMLLFPASGAWAAAPEWAKEPLRRDGRNWIICTEGQGPSADIALSLAIKSAQGIAAQQMTGSTVNVQSLSVETEHSASFHQEVSLDTKASGLQCQPEKSEVENRDGTYLAWVKCRFDLTAAKLAKVPAYSPIEPSDGDPSLLLEKPALPKRSGAEAEISRKGIIQSSSRILHVTSVPLCRDVLIRGGRPRTILCKANPLSIMVDTITDRELIFRADGYPPKHFQVQRERSPAAEGETLEVYFDER